MTLLYPMISILKQFVLALLIISIPYELTIASTTEARKTILILGDSLSAGYGIPEGKSWAELLQKKLHATQSNIQLINASISGDTSANGLNRLPKAVQQHQPDVIVIELGGNDGLRGLPIRHIKKNLESLLKVALNSDATVALMKISIPPNYGKKYTQAFENIYPVLAQQYSIQLLPFLIEDIALKPELMQSDGIHPNEAAQPAIMETMWQLLIPLTEQ